MIGITNKTDETVTITGSLSVICTQKDGWYTIKNESGSTAQCAMCGFEFCLGPYEKVKFRPLELIRKLEMK